MRTLYDLSWKVTEEEYREDPALSYSTLARYDREGFNKLDTLFDKVESPSLLFGSAVDALITGGQKEFENNFMIADFPDTKDSVKKVVMKLFDLFKDDYKSIDDIPNSAIIPITEEFEFQKNWKPETRAKVIREQGFEYYKLLFISQDKKLLDTDTYNDVMNCVKALKESPATAMYFADNNPFDNVVREYQLKFKGAADGVDYRCMADLLVTLHDKQTVIPVDLKTSSHTEWDFPSSFVQWKYMIQARLYWRLIRQNMDKDPFLKDYKLADYRFIVVNRKTLTPLVWEYRDTQSLGTLYYGKNKDIIVRDPYEIGKELWKYLDNKPRVPNGIKLDAPNDIVEWLNK